MICPCGSGLHTVVATRTGEKCWWCWGITETVKKDKLGLEKYTELKGKENGQKN